MSFFIYSSDNKRYYTYNYYLKTKFGNKIFKVSINANMTCPNRNGDKSYLGCSFCSENKSGDFGGDPQKSFKIQFDEIKNRIHKKWPDAKYIAYLQAGTNTYADVQTLKEIYLELISFENVVGLSISTRPDCLSDEIINLLKEISEKTFLTVELGLQTIHNETLEKINRCHTYEDFLNGYNMLKSNGINVCIHIINGLPNETHQMMLETVKEIAKLHPHSIKIHLLHIIKNTRIADEYQKGEFDTLDYEEYINIVCDQLELLPEDVIVQRLTGDGDKNTLIAPLWSLDKKRVMNGIDKEMARRNSVQGLKFIKQN